MTNISTKLLLLAAIMAASTFFFLSSVQGGFFTSSGTFTRSWSVGDNGTKSITNPTSSTIRGTIASDGPDSTIEIQVYGPPNPPQHPTGAKIGPPQTLGESAIIEVPSGGRLDATDVNENGEENDGDADGASGEITYEFV